MIGEILVNGEQTRFEDQRVERSLGQKNIDAPFHQRIDLSVVRLDHLIERGVAIGRVIDVSGNRELLSRGADRTCHEARLVRRALVPLIGGAARQPAGGQIQLARK